ncbi:MAG TPA: patatin-like phospholipase family protein [Mesorhizobium sp.]|jgi:NTE family protein|nr:patatin-like phospholipase family protein [Mesorhizobium sp.]
MNAPPSGSACPSVAVAFGGGGARGLAHVHVIEALDELGVRPAAIAGSSIGAIMGAGMAAGMTGRDIADHARSVLSDRRQVAARVWRSRPMPPGERETGGVGLTLFHIERLLKAFLPPAIPATFEELSIPLKVTATDFFGHELVALETGDLPEALAASSAIPAVFRPVRRDGRLLIDGGILNPVPFDLVRARADIVLAVDVVGAPSPKAKGRLSPLDLALGASQLMMGAITAAKLREGAPAVLVRPAVSGFRVLDFWNIEAVLSETAPVKERAKRALDEAIAAWRPDAGRSAALRLA